MRIVRRLPLWLLLPITVFLTIFSSAQSPQPLNGVVHDKTGAVLIGASVVVTREDGTIAARAATDSRGEFHLAVKAGLYIVAVSSEQFQSGRQTVRFDGSKPVNLRFSLAIASVEQNVSVDVVAADEARIGVDPAQNQAAVTAERDALDRLPVLDQDYITTMSRFLSADATGTNGVSLVVNGMEANGPGVTASAVQSVKINQNPYTALYARPGRARIEITTKAGTPQFHGTLNFLYRNSIFDTKNPYALTKPSEERQYYEGSLTGPLSANKKTSFLLALDDDRDNTQAPVLAQTLAGTVNTNVPNPTHHSFVSGRVFHQYAEGNQFWVGYSYEHRTVRNQGVGGTVLPEAGTDTLFYEHEINVGHTVVLSPHLLNQLHFLVGSNDNKTTSVSTNSQIVVSGTFTGGGAQADFRRTEYHFDGTDIVTYSRGRQELKFGVDVPDISRRGYQDHTNQGGTYYFASLADLQTGHPFSYRLQSGRGYAAFLEKTVAGIIEDNIRLRSNLSVSVGLRYYWQNYFRDIGHNFAPRASFAYAPSRKGKTIVRGGAGLFFDRTGPAPIADLLLYDGVNLKRYIVDQPSYPATSAQLTATPTSIVTMAPGIRIPYTVQYGVGIEQQLNAATSFTLNFIGSRGIGLFRSVDANAPQPPVYGARPNVTLGQMRQMRSSGYQKSAALEVAFRGRPSKYFVGQAQYILGKTYNNTTGITYFPANSNFPDADWARSDNDIRHKFDLLGTLEAGRWFHLGTGLSIYSGKPVNITTGSDANRDGLSLDRPSNTPRNTLHGPAYIGLDLSLGRDFELTASGKKGPVLSVSLNSFNALNHRNDITYIGVASSPFFGRAVAAQPPRRMQLNVELKF